MLVAPDLSKSVIFAHFCHIYVTIVTSKVVGPAVMIKNACSGPVRLLVFRFKNTMFLPCPLRKIRPSCRPLCRAQISNPVSVGKCHLILGRFSCSSLACICTWLDVMSVFVQSVTLAVIRVGHL